MKRPEIRTYEYNIKRDIARHDTKRTQQSIKGGINVKRI